MEKEVKEKRISTLEEYISEIKEIYDSIEKRCDKNKKQKHLFFRGHSDKKYQLIPTVLRDNSISEKEILLDFVHYGPQHNINYEFEKERIQILTDMQHNEIPTRLLDWSLNPLNSLFFAVESRNCEADAEVIVMDPWSYNIEVLGNVSYPQMQDIHIHARALLSSTKDFDYIKEYIREEFRLKENVLTCSKFGEHNIEKPIALVSNFTNNRILHQRGAFTIHGTDRRNMEEWSEFKNNSWRIVIDRCKKEEIFNDLNKLYVNHYSIYPDFHGMRDQIKAKKGLFNI